MAQHDYVIDNQSGLAFRQDLNNALAAAVTVNSGATAPSTTYAYMLWADTTAGLLKQRNAANNAWVTIGTLGSANLGLLPSATAASTYAPLTGTGASGTWGINISGNAATATTATTATTLSGTGPLSATDYTYTADFPSVRPSLLLDFANSKALDPRISYSRASTANYVGADGLIKTAAINEPRFDHNPATGESLGLLIEEARTNILLRSQEIDNTTTWAGSYKLNYSANATTAPDGTATADKVIPNTENVTHSTFQDPAGTISGTYTFSLYAKASGYNKIVLFIDGSSAGGSFGSGSATFDLSTQAITSVNGSASIQALSNGWYRCIVTGTSASAVTVSTGFSIYDNSGNSAFAGNGTDGIFLWGAQLEAGAFPTSYIATTTATVTRSADVAQMTGANFTSWYNSSSGTVYCAGRSNSSANSSFWALKESGNNGATVLVYPADAITAQVYASSTYGINSNIGSYTAGTRAQTALVVKPGDYAACLNGGTVATSTSATAPTITSLLLGNYFDAGTSYDFTGTIARFAYYPARLTNAQLQSLTSS